MKDVFPFEVQGINRLPVDVPLKVDNQVSDVMFFEPRWQALSLLPLMKRHKTGNLCFTQTLSRLLT